MKWSCRFIFSSSQWQHFVMVPDAWLLIQTPLCDISQWCQHNWKVVILYKKNKEPRAAGRMGTSCSENVRGITCKFMVLDWDQGLTFLGLEQIDLKVKLSVLSNHRQIHKSFWKLSFRFPEHLKIFFFLKHPVLLKVNHRGKIQPWELPTTRMAKVLPSLGTYKYTWLAEE